MSRDLWDLFSRLRQELLCNSVCDPEQLTAVCYEMLKALDITDASKIAHEHVLGTLAIVYHSDRFGAPRLDRIEQLLLKYPESAVLNYYGAIGQLGRGGKRLVEYDAELIRARLRKAIELGPNTYMCTEAQVLLETIHAGKPALILSQAGFWNDGEVKILAERNDGVLSRACAECGTLARCRQCAACRVTWYCSRGCQKKDWRAHRTWCHPN